MLLTCCVQFFRYRIFTVIYKAQTESGVEFVNVMWDGRILKNTLFTPFFSDHLYIDNYSITYALERVDRWSEYLIEMSHLSLFLRFLYI